MAEALPWLVMTYANLDWDWLVPQVKALDLQNKAGFVLTWLGSSPAGLTRQSSMRYARRKTYFSAVVSCAKTRLDRRRSRRSRSVGCG